MITLLKDGKPVDFHPFDPTPVKGRRTYLINKKTSARYRVKRYCKKDGSLTLENEKGCIFTTTVKPETRDNYTLVRD